MRFWFWIVALCLSVHLAAPAAGAEATGENLVDEICGEFSGRMGDQDLGWLKWKFVNSAPAVHAPTLSRIDFVTSSDVQSLGPVFVPGNKSRIEFNPWFMRDICFSALLQEAAMRGADQQRLRDSLDAEYCLKARVSGLICLRGGVRRAFEGLSVEDIADTDKAAFVETVRLSAMNAITFLLAHEGAHAIFRSSDQAQDFAAIDEEYEADIVAYLATFSDQALPMAMLVPFATQSLLDGQADDLLPDTHGTSACRYHRTRNLIEAVYEQSVEVHRRTTDPFSPKTEAFDPDMLAMLVARPMIASDGQEDCGNPSDDRIADFRGDLERILAISDTGLENTADDAELLSNLTALAGASYRTNGGRNLARELAANAVLSKAQQEESTRPLMALIGVEQTKAALSYLGGIENSLVAVLGEQPQSVMLAEDLARLRVLEAGIRFARHPAGTPATKAGREFLEDLRAIEAVADPTERVKIIRYQARLLPRREETFRENLQEVMGVASLKMLAGLIADDCDAALEAQLFLDNVIGVNPLQMDLRDPALCALMSEQFRMLQAANLGWTLEDAE